MTCSTNTHFCVFQHSWTALTWGCYLIGEKQTNNECFLFQYSFPEFIFHRNCWLFKHNAVNCNVKFLLFFHTHTHRSVYHFALVMCFLRPYVHMRPHIHVWMPPQYPEASSPRTPPGWACAYGRASRTQRACVHACWRTNYLSRWCSRNLRGQRSLRAHGVVSFLPLSGTKRRGLSHCWISHCHCEGQIPNFGLI